jgi:hypothetical protein
VEKGKYESLGRYLAALECSRVTLTYREIEEIIGSKLPPSASQYDAWWANDKTHTQAKSWLSNGWKKEQVDLGKKVVFVRPAN